MACFESMESRPRACVLTYSTLPGLLPATPQTHTDTQGDQHIASTGGRALTHGLGRKGMHCLKQEAHGTHAGTVENGSHPTPCGIEGETDKEKQTAQKLSVERPINTIASSCV